MLPISGKEAREKGEKRGHTYLFSFLGLPLFLGTTIRSRELASSSKNAGFPHAFPC